MQKEIELVHGGQAPPLAHDYSAPANPLGPPSFLGDVVEDCVSRRPFLRYPSPSYRELREAIAGFHGAEAGEIVVVNGSAEALALLPLLLRARRLVVIEPCFGDHGVQARSQGVELRRVLVGLGDSSITLPVPEEVARLAAENALVVLSRPNNPIGYLVPSDYVYELATRLSRRRSLLVLDEAFIDLAPGAERLGPGDGLVVVRSLTKTFATPGLRLGYVLAEQGLAKRLRLVLQAWPVGGLEECIYTELLLDERSRYYVARARMLVEEENPRLTALLRGLGLRVYPSQAPFLLVRHASLPHPLLQERLVRHGVYVRDASSFYGLDETFSRASVKTPGENDVLVKVFTRVLGGSHA